MALDSTRSPQFKRASPLSQASLFYPQSSLTYLFIPLYSSRGQKKFILPPRRQLSHNSWSRVQLYAPSWRPSSLNNRPRPQDPYPISCQAPHPTKQSSTTFRNNQILPQTAMAILYNIGSLQILGSTGRQHTRMAMALCPFQTTCLTTFPTEAPGIEVQ